MEVTFEETRDHLGMETQRPWHDRAIARTTPALLGLFSILTLTAHLLLEQGARGVRRTAWYAKSLPTFSNAMALMQRPLWDHIHFPTSQEEADMVKIPRSLLDRFLGPMSYAA